MLYSKHVSVRIFCNATWWLTSIFGKRWCSVCSATGRRLIERMNGLHQSVHVKRISAQDFSCRKSSVRLAWIMIHHGYVKYHKLVIADTKKNSRPPRNPHTKPKMTPARETAILIDEGFHVLSSVPQCATNNFQKFQNTRQGIYEGCDVALPPACSMVGSVTRNGSVPLKWLSFGVFVYIWCCRLWSLYHVSLFNPMESREIRLWNDTGAGAQNYGQRPQYSPSHARKNGCTDTPKPHSKTEWGSATTWKRAKNTSDRHALDLHSYSHLSGVYRLPQTVVKWPVGHKRWTYRPYACISKFVPFQDEPCAFNCDGEIQRHMWSLQIDRALTVIPLSHPDVVLKST